MFNKLLLFFSLLIVQACSQETGNEMGDQAQARHDEVILAWAREQHGEHVYYPVATFYGDFSGDGVNDALAWIMYPSGGNSDFLHVALFRNEGGAMVHYRSVDDVFGGDPRNVVFETGRITLTSTMPAPGDPRCCPTGSQDWVIDTQ